MKKLIKTCTKCGAIKFIDAFSLNKNTNDGFNYWCKMCIKKYAIENKVNLKEKRKKVYMSNKTKFAEKARKYRIENIVKIKEQRKKYYIDNKVKLAEKARKYRIENKIKIKEQGIKYHVKNKVKIEEYQKKYRIENKEEIGEINKKYYMNNKAKLAEKSIKYRTENKEAIRAKEECDRLNLKDIYIRSQLAQGSDLSAKDIPQSLIEAKRAQLNFYRKNIKERQ